MKIRITLLGLIYLLISCRNNNTKNTYQPYKIDLISKTFVKENKIHKQKTILNQLRTIKKDSLQIIEYDKKGNLIELRRFGFHMPTLKKYYSDTLLIKKEEYNSNVLKNFTTYHHKNNITIDSSYYAYPEGKQLYSTTKYFKDHLNRDTLKVNTISNYTLKSIYDEKGLKAEYEIEDNKENISKKIINKPNEKTTYNYSYGSSSVLSVEIEKFNESGLLIGYESRENEIVEHNMKYTREYNQNNLPLKDTYYENKKALYEILYFYEYFDD